MRYLKIATALAVLALNGPALGQVLGLGTTKGGATAVVATNISQIVSLNSDMEMRTQALGGTQQYIPMVNAGEIAFGVSNVVQAKMALTGTGLSKGQKYEKLRMVATLMTFRFGPLVSAKSTIKTAKDLRGLSFPYGFKAAPLFGLVHEGFLLDAGLTFDDVKKVPVVGLSQHWDLMKQGRTEVSTGVVGAGIVQEMNAAIPGGVRFVSLEKSPEAFARVSKLLPGIEILTVQPNPHLVGIAGPTNVLAYDYVIWTYDGMDPETVYRVTKVLYDNEKKLQATGPMWRSHKSSRMAKDHGLAYHPGAIKFYKEVGVLPK